MAWEKFEKNRTKKAEVPYKPSTIREVAKKFLTTTSRIKDIQRGEAITREQVRMNKMLKAEKKEEGTKRKLQEVQPKKAPPKKKGKKSPPAATVSTLAPSCRVKSTSTLQNSVLFGTTKISQGKRL